MAIQTRVKINHDGSAEVDFVDTDRQLIRCCYYETTPKFTGNKEEWIKQLSTIKPTSSFTERFIGSGFNSSFVSALSI